MLEYPEAHILAQQINDTLKERKIINVIINHTPHKLAWFNGDPEGYVDLLMGRAIKAARAYGGMVEIDFDGVFLVVGDGTNLTWHRSQDAVPPKHQLLLGLDDRSTIICSVQMYGGIWVFKKDTFQNPYYLGAKNAIPLTEAGFSQDYFIEKTKQFPGLSLKAFLATEQRFVGLGNGVLQDILFKANLHPRTKVQSLDSSKINELHQTIVKELRSMIIQGGRLTETDLYGNHGRYVTISHRYANKETCPHCHNGFIKEPYLGGSIYYCPKCQPIIKS